MGEPRTFQVTTWGGVTATCEGRSLDLGGRVRRSLFVVLLLNANRWVSVADLTARVWPGDAGGTTPVRPRLHVEISRLKGVLPAAGTAHRIERDKDRYRLVVTDDEVDFARFERWVGEAEKSLRAGQPESAKNFARLALDLWTARPFGEFATEPFLVSVVDGLETRRLVAEGIYVKALLMTGHPEEAVLVAERLRSQEPDKQEWHELLGLAYYGSGRSKDALEAVRSYVDDLIEYGLEPTEELHQLELDILDNRSAIAWAVPSAPRALLGKDRPTGPKTFLLARLGPASLDERAPADPVALGYYRAEVTAAVAVHRGYVFDGEGSALDDNAGTRICAVFERPVDAVLAARDAVVALVRVEQDAGRHLCPVMAIHTGTGGARGAAGEAVGSSFGGPDLSYAAGLRDAGHPAEIVVSETTLVLVRDHLEADVRLRYIASWQLDAASRAERVYQLVAPGLPADFPPLRGGTLPTGHATYYTTSFLGREQPTADVARRLEPGALVTITGPGGIGKTRLAVEVSKRPPFGEGRPSTEDRVDVRFCDVSLAESATTLYERIARCVGLGPSLAGDHQAFADALAASPVLLILDGCERRRDDVAALLDDVMHAGLAGRILATSQVRLGVEGEQVVPLEALSLTRPVDSGSEASPAVVLLVDRATTVGAKVRADDPSIAELARRLGGLPLAIELVATHLRSASADALVEHLDDYIDDVTGPRSLPARQRTLRATFDWSSDLLKSATRRLLAGLSVLDGPWSLDAAQAVAPAVDVDPDDVRRLVAELVDLSIVQVPTPERGPAHYRILDTIRTFAAEQLEILGRTRAAADRHAEHFLAFAELALPHRQGPDEGAWVAGIIAEFDNLRATHRHFVKTERWDEAMRLIVALGDELMMRGRLEIGRWAVEVCSTSAAAGPRRAEVEGLAANALMIESNLEQALVHARAALVLDAETIGLKRAWVGHNVMAMAGLAHLEEDPERVAWGVHIRAMETIGDAHHNPFPRALALWNRVFLAEITSQLHRAEKPARRLLVLADQYDNPSIRSMGLVASGRVAKWHDDHTRARDLCQQALGAAQAAHNTPMVDFARQELAELADLAGLSDPRAALAALAPVARSFIHTGNISEQAQTALRIAKRLVDLDEVMPAAKALVRLEHTPMAKRTGFVDEVRKALDRLEPAQRDAAQRDGMATPLAGVLADLLDAVDDVLDQGTDVTDDPQEDRT
jgi:predicted ATPase/DNA-binding SARP family transcriptional activator